MATPYALSSDLVSAWPAKSLAVAQYVDGYKLDTGPVQNAQTGTTYTFLLTDTTKTVTANNSAASAYTVPPQSSVVWEAYTVLRILNLGAGVVTLTAGAGVTLTGTVTVAQYASATLTRTGSNAWTISGNASASGMDLITPTSVAGSGVTLSGGVVSFTAAAAVSVNGCFTSAYENYVYVLNCTATGAGSMTFRYRASSSDNANATYDRRAMYVNVSSAANGLYQATQTSGLGITMAASGASFFGQIFNPQLAQRTRQTIAWNTGDFGGSSSEVFTATTQFDGISFIETSLTGTLRIYGLRNS
jgi:hypothetical protein